MFTPPKIKISPQVNGRVTCSKDKHMTRLNVKPWFCFSRQIFRLCDECVLNQSLKKIWVPLNCPLLVRFRVNFLTIASVLQTSLSLSVTVSKQAHLVQAWGAINIQTTSSTRTRLAMRKLLVMVCPTIVYHFIVTVRLSRLHHSIIHI